MPAPARRPQDASSITAALLSPIVALEGIPAGSPAGAAYTAAIRRRGEDLAAAGGVEALREARAAAVAVSPHHATAIDAAWSAIPGWTA